MKKYAAALLILLIAAAGFAEPGYAWFVKPPQPFPPTFFATLQIFTSPKDIANFLHQNFKFAPDEKIFGEEDYWQAPEEFWKNRKGDCEDYALFSKSALEKLGIEAFVVSLYGDRGYGHTVTVFREEGRYNVINEDRLYNFRSKSIEEALTRIHPGWTWGAVARREGNRGWLIRELQNT